MDNGDIAAAWRAQCVSDSLWLEAENQSGAADGIADGLYLVSDCIDWRRAYVKPRDPGGSPERPAHEKIAFDLAFELQVAVPPVVLIERHDAGTTQARRVCASLVMYPGQAPLWAVRKALASRGRSRLRDMALATVASDAARGIVFDTWVGQTEHHADHPHNIVLGWSDEQSGFVLLDYEYAFGGLDDDWRGARSAECVIAPFPDELLERADATVVAEIIRAIEEFDPTVIEEIVGRIPAEFLGNDRKSEIVEGLGVRKALVRNALRGRFI